MSSTMAVTSLCRDTFSAGDRSPGRTAISHSLAVLAVLAVLAGSKHVSAPVSDINEHGGVMSLTALNCPALQTSEGTRSETVT